MPSIPARPTPACLLMVDDNALGLQARRSVLEELGHRVTAAGSAEEALELLAAGHVFDIVITDYKLPAMNGREFIQEIRNRQFSVAIVLLSGFVDALGLNEGNTGADVVLQKSAQEVSHLLRSVKVLLRRRKPPTGEAPLPSSQARKKA